MSDRLLKDIDHLLGYVPGATLIRQLRSRLLQVFGHRAKVQAVGHIMLMRAAALVGNLCSGMLTAAFLGPDGRGVQAAILLAPAMLTPVATLGLHASLVYNLRSDPEHASRYFGCAIALISLSTLIVGAAGYLLLPTWLVHYSSETVGIARVLLVTMPFLTITQLYMSVLEANGLFTTANKMIYWQSLAAVLGLCVLAGLHRLTPLSSVVAYTLPSVPAFLYLAIQARRVLVPRLTLSAPYPRRLLNFGLRFYGLDVLGILSGYLDQLLIVLLLQPAAVGAYVVALSLSRVLNVAQGAVSTVLFPSIAARELQSVVELVGRAMRITTVVNAAGATALGVVGPSMVLLLYGTRFSAAIAPFLILLCEAVVTSAARTLAQAFNAVGRPGVVTIVEVIGVASSLTAMLVFVPGHGIVGAASATLLGGSVRLLCVLASFGRVLGAGLPRLIIGRADIAWVAGR